MQAAGRGAFDPVSSTTGLYLAHGQTRGHKPGTRLDGQQNAQADIRADHTTLSGCMTDPHHLAVLLGSITWLYYPED